METILDKKTLSYGSSKLAHQEPFEPSSMSSESTNHLSTLSFCHCQTQKTSWLSASAPRLFLLIPFFLLIISCFHANAQNPFVELTYDSLIVYDFDWRGKSQKYRSILNDEGELPPTVHKAVRLDEKTAHELSARLGAPESYGQLTAACFDPHFGMVYYEKGNPKVHVTICLACNYPVSNVDIPARKQGKEEYEGEAHYRLGGFSKEFRKYLSGLKKHHGFSHWKLGGIFDDN